MERTLETLQDTEAELRKTIEHLTQEKLQAVKDLASFKSLYKVQLLLSVGE